MSESPKEPSGFIIDRGENGGLITFQTREDIAKYFGDEAAHFNWFQDRPLIQKFDYASNLASHQRNFFSNWQKSAREPTISDRHFRASLETLSNELRSFSALSKDSANATFLAEVRRTRGDLVAVGVFFAFLPALNVPSHFPVSIAQGMALGFAHKEHLTNDSVTAQKAFFAQTSDDFRSNLAALKTERDEILQLQDKLSRKLKRRLDTIRKLQKRITARWNVANSKLVGAAIDKIELTEKTYKEHMRLKAAVDYWTKKASIHGKRAGEFGRWSGGYATVVILAIAALIVCGIPAIAPIIKFENGAPTATTLLYAAGALTILTVFFWIGRVLVRLYLSEHHLAIDARFRATMTETYLALMNEGAATEAERNIILTALFRPATDGIVKDDAAPFMSLPSAISGKVNP